eukprot:5466765-Prymnesium_polylepis.1
MRISHVDHARAAAERTCKPHGAEHAHSGGVWRRCGGGGAVVAVAVYAAAAACGGGGVCGGGVWRERVRAHTARHRARAGWRRYRGGGDTGRRYISPCARARRRVLRGMRRDACGRHTRRLADALGRTAGSSLVSIAV